MASSWPLVSAMPAAPRAQDWELGIRLASPDPLSPFPVLPITPSAKSKFLSETIQTCSRLCLRA